MRTTLVCARMGRWKGILRKLSKDIHKGYLDGEEVCMELLKLSSEMEVWRLRLEVEGIDEQLPGFDDF